MTEELKTQEVNGRIYLSTNIERRNKIYFNHNEAREIARSMTEEDPKYNYRLPEYEEISKDYQLLNLETDGFLERVSKVDKITKGKGLYILSQFGSNIFFSFDHIKKEEKRDNYSDLKGTIRLIREEVTLIDTPTSTNLNITGKKEDISINFDLNDMIFEESSIQINDMLSFDIENIDLVLKRKSSSRNYRKEEYYIQIFLKSGRLMQITSSLRMDEAIYSPKTFKKKEDIINETYEKILKSKKAKTF